MTEHPIIIDCDPGQDDAIAVLLTLASPEFKVLGITTVAGNVPLRLTSLNARKVRELAGRLDVPVFAGADRPLKRALITAEEVHGKTGLDGIALPEPRLPLDPRHAADFIVEAVMTLPAGTVTLIPVAPLTNIALAIKKAPSLAKRLRGIVLMGGAIGLGNITPATEFNIHVDPEAADIVFRSGASLAMLGLDVTHQAISTPARVAAIRNLGTPLGRAVAAWLDFYNRHDAERYGTEGGPLHDPCAVAYVLWPELFQGKFCHVAVETEGRLTAGHTLVEWWAPKRRPPLGPPNCTVIAKIDHETFFRRLIERLGRL